MIIRNYNIYLLALILLVLASPSISAQQLLGRLDSNGHYTWYREACCEYKQKPNTQIEGYYVLNFSDTIYFKNYRNLLASGRETTNYLNPLYSLKFQSFGVPVNGQVYISHTEKDSSIHTFSGIMKEGHYYSGVFIDYYSDGTIKSTYQVEEGWLTGIHTFYYPSGRINFIEKYIKGATHSVSEWEWDSLGVLIDFYDEEKSIRKQMEKYGY